jgi:hypothetical protein
VEEVGGSWEIGVDLQEVRGAVRACLKGDS